MLQLLVEVLFTLAMMEPEAIGIAGETLAATVLAKTAAALEKLAATELE